MSRSLAYLLVVALVPLASPAAAADETEDQCIVIDGTTTPPTLRKVSVGCVVPIPPLPPLPPPPTHVGPVPVKVWIDGLP